MRSNHIAHLCCSLDRPSQTLWPNVSDPEFDPLFLE
jgi:hypothetical protein